MRISDWSSDVCSSDLSGQGKLRRLRHASRGSRIRGSEPCAAPACPCRKDHRKMPRMSSATTTPQERRITVTQGRSEEHTSELQSLMRISYAVFCLKKQKKKKSKNTERILQAKK